MKFLTPVDDVKFDDKSLPKIHDALHVKNKNKTIFFEVAQIAGDNMVKCFSITKRWLISRTKSL